MYSLTGPSDQTEMEQATGIVTGGTAKWKSKKKPVHLIRAQ